MSFKGRFHDLREVNILPRPVQRADTDLVRWHLLTPRWRAPRRLGDGWMPIMAPDAEGEQKLAALRGMVKSHGRDATKFGIEGWLRMRDPDPQRWAAAADGWRKLGADMVMLYPMYRIDTFDDHIDMLRRFKEVAGG